MSNENQSGAFEWLGLVGRVCVVTGGGDGIGAETARILARAGARVAILDRNLEHSQDVADEIRVSGGTAIAVWVDVAQREAVLSAASEVSRTLGPCNVLVNNAAVRHEGPLLTISAAQWETALAVNLSGPLICSQAFGDQMVRNGMGGSIIHVGSICGHFPRANGGAYSTSKAGLMMLSNQLAVELSEYGIRSNVVAPGFVKTPLSASIYENPEVERRRVSAVPSGRIGTTRDLADMIAFLASDRSSYVNGQSVLVDGGVSQTLMKLVPR
ncbi:3-oxoacyl-[acyl-carrier-protein] reductase [Caballeronia calidae]|uniref:3-oxoacyl-[acyl-carrier-protein] reductase n=1 Tax=Caballeronia calidae TaxID=1777139 RepID=A0A158EFM8_9BURK|nr:SDR family oxidoreductase [Caballeronia calidae]SAL05593.1 3-oxoacyl-[acyl-carrier-protein] reductase [Caballeronia calidae]